MLQLGAMVYAREVWTSQSDTSQLYDRQNAVRFQAAAAQLDLAITFYLVASATKDHHRSNRAIAKAQHAYAAATSSLDCNLKAGQNVEIEEKLTLLNAVRATCPPNALFTLSGNGVGSSPIRPVPFRPSK